MKTIYLNSLLLLFVLFISNFLLGQEINQNSFKIKIVDSETHTSLSNVHATSLKNKQVFISNINGEILLSENGEYEISYIGYKTKLIEVKNSQYIIIELVAEPELLNEILVNSYQNPLKLKESVNAISLLTKEDIDNFNSINFAPVLNTVPGVFMQSGALNTNRITIRGIGSRNLFGTSKIRAYYQDIPLTNGNGETTIEDFELKSISRFEIVKGATSSIYGAGLGGTMHLTPQNSYLNESNASSELTIGSFGLAKGLINFNYGTKNNSIRAIYSNTHSNGYRDNNEYNRQNFSLTSNHYLNEKNNISFIGALVNLKAFIPSSLNREDYENNPPFAAFTWNESQGFEDTNRGIFGFSWNYQPKDKTEYITSIFSSFNKSYEPRPFNILSENSFALGLRSRIKSENKLFNKKLNWNVGFELFKDWYDYQTFDNLYQDFPSGTGSVKGDLISDFEEERMYTNLFVDGNLKLSQNVLLSLGLNYNITKYKIDDIFNNNTVNDQSGKYSFNGIFSPKLGASYLVSDSFSVYSNISHGFSPISIEETLLPNGQINPDIKPETGWNFEIGSRGNILNKKLRYNLSIYRLDIRNLLVARRTSEDQFIGINAGRTTHDGIELSVRHNWIDNKGIKVTNNLSVSLNNYKFKDFIDDNMDFSGNDLTGVSSEVLNLSSEIKTGLGLYANINFQHVGSMPITDDNSQYTEDYNLTNIQIGFNSKLKGKLQLNAKIGVNNLFDTKYASQILINAGSFGGNAPRYYYPGNPINYYTTIGLQYSIK